MLVGGQQPVSRCPQQRRRRGRPAVKERWSPTREGAPWGDPLHGTNVNPPLVPVVAPSRWSRITVALSGNAKGVV